MAVKSAHTFAQAFVQAGMTVVSGLARASIPRPIKVLLRRADRPLLSSAAD